MHVGICGIVLSEHPIERRTRSEFAERAAARSDAVIDI